MRRSRANSSLFACAGWAGRGLCQGAKSIFPCTPTVHRRGGAVCGDGRKGLGWQCMSLCEDDVEGAATGAHPKPLALDPKP